MGADPEKKTRNKDDAPLEYLLWTEKYAAVPLLIEHSSQETLRLAFFTAAVKHKPDLMRQILVKIPEPAKMLTEDAEQRLSTALIMMTDNELQILEQAGLQLPLWAAARFGRLERMKILIAAGTNVDEISPFADRTTPLVLAVRNGQYDAVKLLLENKANPNILPLYGDNLTAVHEAVRRGDSALTRLLTTHGAAVNVLDSLKNPPLRDAVAGGNVELCRVFLEAGADPNIEVNSGEHDRAGNRINLPLWKLAKDPELIKLLKDHGAK